MSRAQRIIEEHKEKHPGIGSYLECVSRAYATGLAGFCLGKQNISKKKFNSLINQFFSIFQHLLYPKVSS
jgi:TMEM141 protein family